MRALPDQLGGTFASLDRPGDLAAAGEDPIGFVEAAARPLFIDEVQRGGDPLVRAVKLAADTDQRRGQFALSGSTRFKLRDASGTDAAVYHFRDRDQREVDLLLESPDGRVVAIEVKASASVDERDMRHLKYLRERLGDQFVQGVTFYTGPRPLPFGDRLMAVPINLLWGGHAPPA